MAAQAGFPQSKRADRHVWTETETRRGTFTAITATSGALQNADAKQTRAAQAGFFAGEPKCYMAPCYLASRCWCSIRSIRSIRSTADCHVQPLERPSLLASSAVPAEFPPGVGALSSPRRDIWQAWLASDVCRMVIWIRSRKRAILHRLLKRN